MKFREAHKNAIEFNKTHTISLDQAYSRQKGTTEKMERRIKLRIKRKKTIGRAIARVKRKVFQLVMKLFFPIEMVHMNTPHNTT